MKTPRAPGALACLCVLSWTFASACNEKPEVAAADVPGIEIRASVAAAQTASAVTAVDGRVATVLASEGAAVQQGALVATLTNPGIERDIAYAKAQVAVAEQRLRAAQQPAAKKAGAGDRARERATAEILKNREAKRDRYRQLYATRDISKQELEDAENEYAAALRDWLAERERATQNVVQTDDGILRLELERARAELAFANERRGLLEVHAPMSGIVTRVAARPGEMIFPRDAILEIANNATVEVRGTIAPELQRFVHRGMPVEVKVLTVPPRRFNVPVKNVLPGTVVVELPNPEGVLNAGQNALITVKR